MARQRERLRSRRARGFRQGGVRPYLEVAIRAAEEALERNLIDKYWEILEELSKRPEIQEAEAVIWKAISNYYSPEQVAARLRRRKRARRSSRRRR